MKQISPSQPEANRRLPFILQKGLPSVSEGSSPAPDFPHFHLPWAVLVRLFPRRRSPLRTGAVHLLDFSEEISKGLAGWLPQSRVPSSHPSPAEAHLILGANPSNRVSLTGPSTSEYFHFSKHADMQRKIGRFAPPGRVERVNLGA